MSSVQCHFDNHFSPFRSFLSLLVVNGKHRHSLPKKKKQNQGFTVVHLQAETGCRSMHALGFTTAQKTLWKIRTGPPGPRAAGPWRAVGRGPSGRGGPWAAGRWAFGPPGRWAVAGRGGPWAVGRGPLGRGPAFSKTRGEEDLC